MRIPRLYLPGPYQLNESIRLNKEQAHYALTVLRLKNDHPLEVFDGQATQAQARLQVINKREAQIEIIKLEQPSTESPLQLTLVQGISRGERMDYSLQKAVELGVSQIQPVFTERCEVRLSSDKLEKRRQQWQALVISACEQSGRVRVPKVAPLMSLTQWLQQQAQPCLGLVLDPYADTRIYDLAPLEPTQNYALLIGPEGGLSDEEVNLAQQHGLTAIRLGPRILRTETAAPTILAILQQRWGDL